MHLDLDYATQLTLLTPKKIKERLKKSSFRSQPLAGSFAYWSSLAAMILDERLRNLLVDKINEMRTMGNVRGLWRFTLDYGSPIGWPGSVMVQDLSENTQLVTVRFVPTAAPRNHYGTSVKQLKAKTFVAPLTSLVTFVLVLREDVAQNILGRVEAVYPGDVSVKQVLCKEAVFLGHECPGTQLPEVDLTIEEAVIV